jgi:cell division septum initiation protein DivIVA
MQHRRYKENRASYAALLAEILTLRRRNKALAERLAGSQNEILKLKAQILSNQIRPFGRINRENTQCN